MKLKEKYPTYSEIIDELLTLSNQIYKDKYTSEIAVTAKLVKFHFKDFTLHDAKTDFYTYLVTNSPKTYFDDSFIKSDKVSKLDTYLDGSE
ncbi:hypothetical protein ACI2JA_03315 [Alkalihalobacillus sp. NPDC078783]